MSSPKRMLAEVLLDEPLEAYVRRKREEGLSWRKIPLEVYKDTDGKVSVTYETLRSWFPEAVA